MLFFILLPVGLIAQDNLSVTFSIKGGIYSEPQDVELSSLEGSSIFYSKDGSYPNMSSIKYSGVPILTDSISVIRAVSYHEGKKSSINTQSFFCNRAHSLPIVSISSDPSNFWDFGTGIYVKGCCADSTMPYYGANFWKSWEKPCNIEIYQPDGEQCINQRAGMSLFGGYSRMLPQKSIAIIARKKFGKSRFEYPIFQERNTKKYKSFIVRNSGGDFKKTQLRDAFMTQLAKPTGVAIQAYEPAIVYINGVYWGIQNIREKISEHYLKSNFKVNKDNVDILRHNGVKRHGYSKNYKHLLYFLRSNDLSDNQSIDSLSKFMNIQDFINYNICEIYSGNQDAGGNIRYFRERTSTAKWRWIFYDLDLGLSNDKREGYKENTLLKFTTASNEVWPNPSWSTFIIRSLLINKKLEEQYINTFSDLLNTAFHSDTAEQLLTRMKEKIATEIPYHQKRWGASVKNWNDNIEIVRTFIRERPEYLKGHLIEKFGLDDMVNIKIAIPEGHICKIRLNTLYLKNSFTGDYFNSVPITVSVKPKHDYEFVGWKGRKETTAILVVNPEKNMTLEPILRPRDSSLHKDGIIINEISLKQVMGDSVGDWIELYNRTDQSINLNGWSLSKLKFSKRFLITDEVIIGPKTYIVLARSKSNVIQAYNLNELDVSGDLGFGLSKEGDVVKLYDKDEKIVDYVRYDDIYGAIDSSFTLAMISPDSSRLDALNWLIQDPTPLEINSSYKTFLFEEANAKEFKRNALIFGGIVLLFIVLIGAVFARRSYKKRQVLKNLN